MMDVDIPGGGGEGSEFDDLDSDAPPPPPKKKAAAAAKAKAPAKKAPAKKAPAKGKGKKAAPTVSDAISFRGLVVHCCRVIRMKSLRLTMMMTMKRRKHRSLQRGRVALLYSGELSVHAAHIQDLTLYFNSSLPANKQRKHPPKRGVQQQPRLSSRS